MTHPTTLTVAALAAMLALGSAALAEAPPPDADMLRKRAAEEGLKPGTMLGADNAAMAEAMLPPEVLRHYEKGEYRNPIVDWPDGVYKWSKEFTEATKRNGDTLDVDDDGTIVDKATGKQPALVYGIPFPNIDPNDPKAGTKVVWNYFYSYYEQGNSQNSIRLDWVSPTRVERSAGQNVYFLYYDGQASPYRIENPNNLSQQMIAATSSPADLQGTTALTWRFRDSDKRDSNWVYVPALRRVRAVSPANRSDGFLGSDMSQDDGPFFDGKPEDFSWKLVDERDALRLADPESLKGTTENKPVPGGGFRSVWPDKPRIGFQDPTWSGIKWAPIAAGLAKRKVWVIEAVPKDKYYHYGKLQLWIDKETYQGAYNRKFSWDGELLNTLQVTGYLNQKVGETKGQEDWVWGSSFAYQCAENVKMNRATLGGDHTEGKDIATDRRIPLRPSFFDQTTLQRFGK